MAALDSGGSSLPVHIDTTGNLIGKVLGPVGEGFYDAWKVGQWLHDRLHKAPVYTPEQARQIKLAGNKLADPGYGRTSPESIGYIPHIIGSDLPPGLGGDSVTVDTTSVKPKPLVSIGPSDTSGGPIESGVTLNTNGANGMAVTDLGSFVAGLGQDVVSWLAPQQNGGTGGTVGSTPGTMNAIATTPAPASTSSGGYHPSYAKRFPATVYVDAQGNIVHVTMHSRRRRRRAIMTNAQAGQLELASSVLGKGQLLKQWIASHSN